MAATIRTGLPEPVWRELRTGDICSPMIDELLGYGEAVAITLPVAMPAQHLTATEVLLRQQHYLDTVLEPLLNDFERINNACLVRWYLDSEWRFTGESDPLDRWADDGGPAR
jgi:hypothetical protein